MKLYLSRQKTDHKIGFDENGKRSREKGVLQWAYIQWFPVDITFDEFVSKVREGYSFMPCVFWWYDIDDINKYALKKATELQHEKYNKYQLSTFFGLIRKRGRKTAWDLSDKAKERLKYGYRGIRSGFHKDSKTIKGGQLIVFDIDNADCPLEEAINRLDIKPHFAYTTVSNDDSLKKYKYRFIYVLDDTINCRYTFNAIYRNVGLKTGVFRNFYIDKALCNYTQYIQGCGKDSYSFVNKELPLLSYDEYSNMSAFDIIEECRKVDLTRYAFGDDWCYTHVYDKPKDDLKQYFDAFPYQAFDNTLHAIDKEFDDYIQPFINGTSEVPFNAKEAAEKAEELYDLRIKREEEEEEERLRQQAEERKVKELKELIENTTNVSLPEDGNTEFWNDLHSDMKRSDFILKYRDQYPYFCHSDIEFNENGYALLDEDYREIIRPFYIESVSKKDDKHSENTEGKKEWHVKKRRDGERRRKTLYRTALLMRQMKKNSRVLTREYLTYLLICESLYYYDNTDLILSNKTLREIADYALAKKYEEINFTNWNRKKFKVDCSYAYAHGMTPQ